MFGRINLGGDYPTAFYRLMVNGDDISQVISPRLISLTLTDNPGIEADQLSIDLSDHDGLLAIPPRGAIIRLWLGWSVLGLVDKGTFVVNETEHSGTPDVLSIRAASVDFGKTLKTKREQSFKATTLGEVLTTIAGRNSLTPKIAAALTAVEIPQLDQANESDANLLTRLGKDFGATISVKAGCLVCLPFGASQSASGLALPHIYLNRQSGDSHRFLQADRDSYEGVRAYYYDTGSAEKKEAIAGGGENLKDLRHTYANRSSALRAARAEWQRIQSGSASLSYTLAIARPELIPELTYTLQGIKPEIDAITWHGKSVQHSLSPDSGYTMSLEFEKNLN